MSTATGNWQNEALTQSTHNNHVVLFYDKDAALGEAVVEYIAAGLSAHERVIVLATPEHRRVFIEGLDARAVDVVAALRAGGLQMLDARETLSAFMVHGVPDPTRFECMIGEILGARTRDGAQPRVRVYGEMVDVLCQDGKPEAAVQLEQLWNDLAKKRAFSLFCAYVRDNVSFNSASGNSTSGLYKRVCDAHTHVLSTDPENFLPTAQANDTHSRLRSIGELQRRARVLEGEIQRTEGSDLFRLLVDSVKDYAIFVLDTRGFIRTWNAGAERIKGYTADEIIGQHLSRFYPDADTAVSTCEQELETAAAEGRWEDEGWRQRKDGTLFWASVVITALRDASGKLVGFAKVTRDLTDRRKAEEARLRLAQAREANRVKDEFLATISHELRTPLNAMLGWGKLLLQGDHDEFTAKAVATIVRSAQAQAHLIEDVLDVSRIIAGKLRIDPHPTDLTSVVREAVEVVQPSADAKRIVIRLEGCDAPMACVGDATRLEQVIWNLLSNAVKFTDGTGSIVVRLEREDACLRLSVRDTGQGISPDFLPHVFDRFQQADSSAGRRERGLGLGLAIVRHLVELHGGKAEATSEGTGKGATFTITLPVHADAASVAPVPGDDDAEPTHLAGISVLVVDDEPDARDLLKVMLEMRGATVMVAESASEARACLESFRPHVIVSDVGLPGEDGYSFVRSLRDLPHERGGATPTIALTGYAGAPERRRAFDAGFTNHVAKPVDPEELASAIRNLARSARSAPRA